MSIPPVPRSPRLPAKPFSELTPLEQRIDLLCRLHGASPGALGERAGLSTETVTKMLMQARAGKQHPGSAETYVTLALFYGVPVEWLLGRAKISADSKVPSTGAEETTTGGADRLSLADQAARKLSELHGIQAATAWGAMRGAEGVDLMALYEEGWRRIQEKAKR